MNKDELLKEIVELETKADFIRNNALIDTYIEVIKYGAGKIQEQDECITQNRC